MKKQYQTPDSKIGLDTEYLWSFPDMDEKYHYGNPLVRMENISKHFGGKAALEQAHMELHGGEVLGLLGDNRAAKSTMLKIPAGVLSEGEDRICEDF